jgi:hypothetical protein
VPSEGERYPLESLAMLSSARIKTTNEAARIAPPITSATVVASDTMAIAAATPKMIESVALAE